MTIGEMQDFKQEVTNMENETLMRMYARHLKNRSYSHDYMRKTAIFVAEICKRWGN
jgi:hypothetical protein